MKKIAMIFLLLLTVTACSSSYLSKLNYKKLMTKLDNKESFVLYLTNEDESGLTLKNTLQTVCKNNNIKCFYLNTDNLDEDELDSLKEKIQTLVDKYNKLVDNMLDEKTKDLMSV